MGEESPTPSPPGPGAPRGSGGPGHGRRQLSALSSSQLGRPLWGGQPTRISVALWAQWGLPGPGGPTKGACLPLSKHRGMMWSFDSGTGGLGQIPGVTKCVRACVCVCMCLHVRACKRILMGQEGTRTGGLWGLCKWPQMANRAPTWLLDIGECWPSSHDLITCHQTPGLGPGWTG